MQYISSPRAAKSASNSIYQTWRFMQRPWYLAEKSHLSRKFRDIVISGNGREYVGVAEVAIGGTFQHFRVMRQAEFLKALDKKASDPTSSVVSACGAKDTAGDSPSQTRKAESTNSALSTSRPRITGKKLERHNEIRRKGRIKDVLGKVSRYRVPASRRIHIVLTSLRAVHDARGEIGKIVRHLAKIEANEDLFAVWVAGLQQRGYEHFHLYLYLPGSQSLNRAVHNRIYDFVEERWAKLCDQQAAPETSCTIPEDDEDVEILNRYLSDQSWQQTKTRQEDQGADSKKKSYGIICRDAYSRAVQLESFVLLDIHDYYDARRLARRALQAETRSWSTPKRHRPCRYAVQARYHQSDDLALQILKFIIGRQHQGGTPPPPLLLP